MVLALSIIFLVNVRWNVLLGVSNLLIGDEASLLAFKVLDEPRGIAPFFYKCLYILLYVIDILNK